MQALDSSSLLHVLSSLGDAADAARAACVSKTLHVAAAAPSIWRSHLHREYGIDEEGLRLLGAAAAADAKTAFAALKTAPPPAALRFLAAYTNGGTDGGTDELQYWADSAFQPNAHSPHCTDGPVDVSVVALLKGKPHAPDVARAAHRAYMIERCTCAAALLFAPPGGARHSRQAAEASAARMLRTWSTVGIERLFADLFQDLLLALAQQQQQQPPLGGAAAAAAALAGGAGNWGRLLLDGVEPHDVPRETERLRRTFVGVVQRAWLSAYKIEVVDELIVTDAEAASHEAAARLGVMMAAIGNAADDDGGREEGGVGGGGAEPDDDAAAAEAAAAEAAAEAAAAPAVADEGGGAAAGAAPPEGGGDGAAAAAAAAEAEPPEPPEVWLPRAMAPSRVRQRYQVDSAALSHLLSPPPPPMPAAGARGFGAELAVVDSLVVSRSGHFTAPVSCGAIFFGVLQLQQHQEQQQQQQQEGQQAQEQQEDGQQPPLWRQHEGPLRRLVALPFDPMTAALRSATSADDVVAAVAEGSLPPIAAHRRLPGAEYIEFARLPARQLRARRACGFPLAPVVWWRFASRSELPPALAAQGQAALNALAPGDEADEIVLPADEDEDDAAAAAAAAATTDDEEQEQEQEDNSGSGDGSPSALSLGEEEEEEEEEERAGSSGGSSGGSSSSSSGDDDDAFVSGDSSSGDGDGEGAALADFVDADDGQQQAGGGGASGGGDGGVGSSGGAASVRVLPRVDLEETAHRGPPTLVLPIKLKHRRAGNAVLVKLIESENLMRDYNDNHDSPNIDIQYLAIKGWALELAAASGSGGGSGGGGGDGGSDGARR